MARSFSSLSALQFGFLQFFADIPVAAEAGLTAAVSRLLHTVRGEPGTYQPARGPFKSWAALAISTNINRVAMGYTPDDPELMSGQLVNSYTPDVQYPDAGVGSPLDNAVWQEFGTANMPARPILGMSLLECEKQAFDELELALWRKLAL